MTAFTKRVTPKREFQDPTSGRGSEGAVAAVAATAAAAYSDKTVKVVSRSWDAIVALTLLPSGVERHNLVLQGLSTQILKNALETFQLVPEARLLHAIGLSSKTLGRREETRLGPRHSDAAMALIEVTEMADRVLGSRSLAENWLTEPALALDGQRPLDLISSTPGIEAVKDLLTRMEYGVYA